MAQATIGIIGGSGLYQMEALQDVREVSLDTPFGPPSDAFVTGTLEGMPVAFLARHGRNHHLSPSEIPFRANIHALKQLGVSYVIAASAVGSLQADASPLDMVVPDQFIDRTRERRSTFFGEGVVAHISFADPVCPQLAQVLADAIAELELPQVGLHRGGTYVCIEGPAFSTQAESHLYRSWGGTVVGMTNLPEAKLAREAEMAYATLALVTDYDCWHPDHGSVSVEMVIDNLKRNAANAQRAIQQTVRRLQQHAPSSQAHQALKSGILTPLDRVPSATRDKLHVLLQKYL
jgi:5'-methylthioadenosine phosphorylase